LVVGSAPRFPPETGAKILFFVFLILAVLSFLAHGFGRRRFLG
jgi:hypothetical protein